MLVILINNLISIFSTGSSTVSSDGSCAILFLMLCGVASISVTAVCRFHRIPACLPASCVIPMSRGGGAAAYRHQAALDEEEEAVNLRLKQQQ